MPESIRDHGFGDSPEVRKPPRLGDHLEESCPHCGCSPVFMVEVDVVNPPAQLHMPKGSKAVGQYVGCAACPYASPMVTVARTKGN
jgi:hypothetical protein